MNLFKKIFSRIFTEDKQVTNDQYVNSCLQLDFEEFDDDRVWYNIDEMKRIHELAESGELEKALALAKTILLKYYDFYYLYCKIGTLLDKLGRSSEAEQLYFQGLEKSRSKADICNSLGNRAFERKDFKEAVRWWIKSAVIQLVAKRLIQGFPFLSLAYIAEGFELKACHEWLVSLADRVSKIRFNDEATNLRYKVAVCQDSNAIKQLIIAFWKQYQRLDSCSK